MNAPKIAHGAAFEISSAMFGMNWMKNAPYRAPEIEARPPTTMPTRNTMDRKMLKLSGATNCTATAPSAPAMPVYMAEAPAQQVPREDKHDQRNRQGKEVEPLVGVERQTERCGRLHDHNTLNSAGPLLQQVVFEELRHCNTEGEGGQRQVQPLQPERR